jgi:hypothetical protein
LIYLQALEQQLEKLRLKTNKGLNSSSSGDGDDQPKIRILTRNKAEKGKIYF